MPKGQHAQEKPLLAILISISTILVICGYWWASGGSVNSFFQSSSQQNNKDNKKFSTKTYNFSQVNNIPSGLFNYGGSTTWAPIRKKVDRLIQTTWSEYQLRYTNPVTGNPGSGTGIRMLLDGQLSFSQSSRPLKEEEYHRAKNRGFSLKQIPIALDGIAIAVHPDLPINGLTLKELGDIYSGKLTNWKQIGGLDLPIVPYSRNEEEGGTVAFFVDNVLDGESFGNNIQLVRDTTDGIRKVASNPSGIYYATTTEIVPQCQIKPLPIGRKPNNLIAPYQEPYVTPSQCPLKRDRINKKALQSGTYPITRRLFVIVKQNGQKDETAGNAYAQLLLTDLGQELIDKAGFIRIR